MFQGKFNSAIVIYNVYLNPNAKRALVYGTG